MLITNTGKQIAIRFSTLSCLSFSMSARMRRAQRRAVSPVVMGAMTTPRMASTAPNDPSQLLHILLTKMAGLMDPLASSMAL